MALLARAIFCAKCAEKCHPLAWANENSRAGDQFEQLKGERFERN